MSDSRERRTSDLLAFLDGELDPAAGRALRSQAQTAAELAALRQARRQLRALPDVEPAPMVWERIRARLDGGSMFRDEPASEHEPMPAHGLVPRSTPVAGGGRSSADPGRSFAAPLAVAAGLLVLLCASILFLSGSQMLPGQDQGAGTARLEAENRALQALQVRSRQLEPLVSGIRPGRVDPAEQALLYRIADLDAELAGNGRVLPRDEAQLWESRVALLESLAQGRRARAVLQPAVY